MTSTSSPKLKLLCLHGYMQDAEVFKNRVGSVRKALKSRAELIFIDAPFAATGLGDVTEAAPTDGSGGRSWWQWTDEGSASRPSRATVCTGWDVTLAALGAAIREHRPDGVLGFSQGATATALLLASLQAAEGPGRAALLGDAAAPRFAILVAGFFPKDVDLAALMQRAPVSTPSLFVHGEADEVVPAERTAELQGAFLASATQVFRHAGGHMVPTCSGDFKAGLLAFVDAQQTAGLEK